MALYVDATALIALGSLHAIEVLRHFSERILITPEIQNEVRSSSAQITAALTAGWMIVETPSASAVNRLRAASGLHQGESELIEVASHGAGTRPQLLIDEARAFKYLRRTGLADLLCLAQVLHRLETQGHITSCQAVMDQLVQSETYRWAKVVRRYYEDWCAETGHTPV